MTVLFPPPNPFQASGLKRRRSALLIGCGLGLSLALALAPERAAAQAFNATPNTDFGTVVYDRATPGIETIQVESNTAVINWSPPSMTPGDPVFEFLPAGNTATFQNGPNNPDFVVLNRILTDLPSRFDGTVISQLVDLSGDAAPGGTLLFSSPGGIIAGATSLFDVGNLVLTTLNVVVDGGGNFVTPDGGFAFDDGAVMPNAAVVTEAGSQVLASSAGSYVAFVAPRIVHGGLVRTNGSTAYVAAEEVELTVNNGLFDIVIGTGSDNANPIVHTGTTGGPASAGGTDNHVIYMVALPKNQAITALLSGQVGYDPATDVTIENGVIILSSGYQQVFGTSVNTFTPSAVAADFHVTGGTATSDLFGYASNDMFASGATASLSFEQDVSLFGRARARLLAADGETVSVGGNALVSTANFVADGSGTSSVTAGEALVSAQSGGTVSVAGTLEVDADAFGETGFDPGDGSGGTAWLLAQDGDIQVGGAVLVHADGVGAIALSGGGPGGDGLGGSAQISASGQGSITVLGNLAVRADGTGGDNQMSSLPGNGTGGEAILATAGDGTITVSGDALVQASGFGGANFLGDFEPPDPFAGADGSGGSATVAAAGAGGIEIAGALAIEATGQGSDGAIGGNGGNGAGGTATLSVAAVVEAGSIDLGASGLGGSGGTATEDGLGNARAGGAGGLGAAGEAAIEMGANGELNVVLASLFANGQGGAGGGGSSGSASGGQGGAGGAGLGGTARIDTSGGAFAVIGSGGINLYSTGLGGSGGAGGDAAGGVGPGGDGGGGGGGTAGISAVDIAGGSVTTSATQLASDGFGGAGGAGGNHASAPGAGGAIGAASGGLARITVAGGGGQPGSASLGSTTLTANAPGEGGVAGPADVAGRIIVTDVGTTTGGLTFAQLSASAVGAAAAPGTTFTFSSDAGPVAVGGDVDIDVTGDASFAASGSGGLQAGGDVTVSASDSILFAHASPAAGAAILSGDSVDLSAGADISAGQGSLIAATALDATLSAPVVDVDQVTAARDILIDGDDLTIADAVAGRDILLDASAAIRLGTAEAGDDFRASSAGSFSAASVTTTGLGPDGSGTGGPGSDVPAGSNIIVETDGAIRLDAGNAASALNLTSSSGSIASSESLAAGTDVNLAAATGLDLGEVTAGGAIDLVTDGDLGAGQLTAAGPITTTAGGGAAVDSAEASEISIDAAGDLRLDNGESTGSIRLASSAGSVLSAGELAAGSDLELTAAADILVGDVSAGNDVVLDSVNGAISLGVGNAGRDLSLFAVASIEADTLTAGRVMDVETFVGDGDPSLARSITLGSATAGLLLTVGAYGPLVADSLTVIGPGLVYAGSTDSTRIGTISSGGDVQLFMSSVSPLGFSTNDGTGGIEIDAITAQGNVNALNETSGIMLGNVDAGASITIRTSDPDPAFGGFTTDEMTAGDSILIDVTGAAGLGSLAAGGIIDVQAASIDIMQAAAGTDISLAADEAILAESLGAGGGIDAQGAQIEITEATAGTDIFLVADGAILAGSLGAGGGIDAQGAQIEITEATAGADISLAAGGVIRAGSLGAGGGIDVQSARIEITGATAGTDISLAADGAILAGSLEADGGIDAQAARIDITQAVAGTDISLGADGEILAGSLAAGGNVGAQGGRIEIAQASAGQDIDLAADGDILVGSAAAGDDFRAVAGAGFAANSIEARGAGEDSEAGEGTLAGAGSIDIESVGDLRLDRADAAGNVRLAASSGSISSATSLAAGGVFAAAAGGDGSFAALDAADVDIAVQRVARFDGAVDASTIAVSSSDIVISETGSLGTADTNLVVLTALARNQPVRLGGSPDGPGYALSNAEAGRVTAATLRFQAPQMGSDPDRIADLLIGDLSLNGDRIGRLEVVSGGIAQVDGAVLLENVRAEGGLLLEAGERIQIVTPGGSLRVRGANGLPGGTLTLAAPHIWSTSASLLARLRADPNFAGRNEALLLNNGPIEPRGYIEGAEVTLRASDTLFVQNSGEPGAFAGITVVENTLRIVPTGDQPLVVFAFGRRINSDGSFVTNSLFFTEVLFDGRGGPVGYTDDSEFNRCIINTGACPTSARPIDLPQGADILERPVDGDFARQFDDARQDEPVDTSFSADPLTEESVTSGADSILWDCDMDGDGDCDEDD